MNSNFPSQLNLSLSELVGSIFNFCMSALPWFFLYSFLGLILAVIVCIIIAKKKLLVREHVAWNLFSKLTYLTLIITLPLAIGLIGSLHHIQKSLHEALQVHALPVVIAQMPAFNAYLTQQTKAFEGKKVISVKDLIEPLITEASYKPQSNSFWERIKKNLINIYLLKTAEKALTEGLQALLTTQIQSLGNVVAVESTIEQPQDELVELGSNVVTKFTTDSAKKLDYTKLNSSLPQVLINSVRKILDHQFQTLYLSIVLSELMVILLIAAEIYFYRRLLRQRNARLPDHLNNTLNQSA